MKNHSKFSFAAALALTAMVPNLAFSDQYYISWDNNLEAVYSYNWGKPIEITTSTFGADINNEQNNVVEIDLPLNNTDLLEVYGSSQNDTKDALRNSVYLRTGKVSVIMGGYSYAHNANYNTVVVEDNYNMANYIHGGVTANPSGQANYNTVIVKTKGDIGSIIGGDGGEANHNTIIVQATGSVGSVFGGKGRNGANNNTIELYTGVEGHVAGGELCDPGKDCFTNNTLRIKNLNVTAQRIYNFNTIEFDLPTNVKNGSVALNLINNNYKTDLGQTDIVVFVPDTHNLQNGDIVHLIQDSSNGYITKSPKSGTVKLKGGLNLGANDWFGVYDKSLYLQWGGQAGFNPSSTTRVTPSGFLSSINSISVDEETKTFLESKLAQSIMVNESANNLSENLQNISNLHSANQAKGVNISSFAFLGAGNKKYKTGSFIEQKSVSLNAGVVKNFDLDSAGELLGGLFLEAGTSKYQSELDSGFTNEGNAKFFGIGGLAKKEFKNNFYSTGAIRIGQAINEYEDEFKGFKYDFEFSSLYFGFDFGVGKILNLSSSNALDIHAKYFFAHTNSDEESIGGGSSVKFDAVDSHQITIGAKDDIALNETSKIFALGNVNYKFGGESNGVIQNSGITADIPSPALKGVYFGLGVGYESSWSKNLDLNIAGKVYLGKEEGVGLNLGAKYKF